MGCRCSERRTMLSQAAQAARQGQLRQAAQQTGNVMRTMREDAAQLARRAAERARLTAAAQRRR